MKSPAEIDSLNWSQDASERLKSLMRFLLDGVWGLSEELQSDEFPITKPLTQRELAATLGSFQGTIGEWKRGRRPSLDGQKKLAAYCRQSLKYLQDYLEGRVSLVDFCKRVQPDLQATLPAFDQIVELLPKLQVHERAEIMHRCIDSWVQESEVSDSLRPASTPLSLSWLIFHELVKPQREWSSESLPLIVFLQMAELSFSNLELVLTGSGSIPATVLKGLAKVLTKDLASRTAWSLEELHKLATSQDSEVLTGQESFANEPLLPQPVEQKWIELEPGVVPTIGALIDVEMKNRPGYDSGELSLITGIRSDRLSALREGSFPDEPELCLLSLGLRKQPEILWTVEELRQIRDNQFPVEELPPPADNSNKSNG